MGVRFVTKVILHRYVPEDWQTAKHSQSQTEKFRRRTWKTSRRKQGLNEKEKFAEIFLEPTNEPVYRAPQQQKETRTSEVSAVGGRYEAIIVCVVDVNKSNC